MANKISFIMLRHSGKTVRQVTLSTPLVALLLLLALGTFGLFGVVLYDHHAMRNRIADHQRMARTIENQREAIGQQRMQVQAFAHEINALKDRLVELDQFERKIRVIANLDTNRGDDHPFGIGGAAPDDLDPQLELNRRHESLMRAMHRQVATLGAATHRQTTDFSQLLDKLKGQRSLLAATPAIRPADGWTTSRFGYRTSPFTGKKEFHKGVDIANRAGSAVLATASGVVAHVGEKGAMGNVLVVDHGHGLVTRYAHLHDTLKQPGDTVNRGETIARMGNSGRSTGPHLHYEVLLNGVPVNPDHYILN